MKNIMALMLLWIFSNSGFCQNYNSCYDKNTNLWGICVDDSIIVDFQFDLPAEFYDSLTIVRKNRKYGIIDLNGRRDVDYRYDGIYPYHDRIFVARTEDKIVLMSNAGKVLKEIRAKSSLDCRLMQDLLILNQDDKWGVVDLQGNIVCPFYQLADDYRSAFKTDGSSYADENTKYRVIRDDGKMGLINLKGELAVDFKFEFLQPLEYICGKNYESRKCCLVKENGKYFFIDEGQHRLFGDFYVENGFFLDNWILAVKKDGQIKEVDLCTGNAANPYKHSKITALRDGNNKMGMLSRTGEIILPFIYDNIAFYSLSGTGYALGQNGPYFNIFKNDKCGLADTTGRVYLEPLYDWVDYILEGVTLAEFPYQVQLGRGLAIFVFDKAQQKLVQKSDFIYTEISYMGGNNGRTAMVTDINGRKGTMDQNGNVIME